MLFTKEQPVFAFRAGSLTFLQEGAEWRDTGPRTNHNQWRIVVRRHAERFVRRNKDSRFFTATDTLADPSDPAPDSNQ